MPSLINLLALAVYTRLLDPNQYGEFVLVYGVVVLSDLVLTQWVRLALLRFLPAHRADRAAFLSSVASAFCLGGLAAAVLAAASLLVLPGVMPSDLVLLGLVLLWTHAWHLLNLELARSDLLPRRFAALGIARAACVLAISAWLASRGFGARGLLIGSAIGTAVPLLWTVGRAWSGIRFRLIDLRALRSVFAYGLPLSITLAMGVVVSKSDRLMLGWLDGPSSAGLYAVGYDLTEHAVMLPLMVVALAGYPLMLRAMEEAGPAAARRQMKENGTWLLALGVPTAIGFTLLGDNVTSVLIGDEFQASAAAVLPWIAVGVMVGSFRAFFFDHAFHLTKRVILLLWVTIPAAVLNIVLNWWWIPRAGIMGAAYATLISYLLSLVLSVAVGRRLFVTPWPWGEARKILLASLPMAGLLLALRGWSGSAALLTQVAAGGAIYLGGVMLMDVGQLRSRLIGSRPFARTPS